MSRPTRSGGKGLDWVLYRSPDTTLREHLAAAYRSFKLMLPRAKLYGVRYLYDYKYRITKRKRELNTKAKKLYGSNFLNNRPAFRRKLSERDGWKCRGCPYTGKEEMTIDHIQPVSRGGTSDLVNLQLLCQRCHSTKSSKDLREFKKQRKNN